jgi:hypothetical protein
VQISHHVSEMENFWKPFKLLLGFVAPLACFNGRY